MMSIELDVSIEKKGSVSEKTTIILLTFLQEKKESYISIQREYFIHFMQLLVKRISA